MTEMQRAMVRIVQMATVLWIQTKVTPMRIMIFFLAMPMQRVDQLYPLAMMTMIRPPLPILSWLWRERRI